MKRFLTASLFVCLLSLSAYAANLYILYDPACMDRLEYTYLNNENGAPYVVYHVNTYPGEKIILDVGAESDVVQNFPPAQFIRCSNAVFDEKLVNDINSNIDRVFIVIKKGENSYVASPIIYAARFLQAEDFVLYDSPKYRFQFDLKMGAIGENIALRNPKARVYFEGRLENDCSGAYLFTQTAEFAGNPHTDLVLVPEVGIVEERSGINAEDAMKNTLRLNLVNGQKLAPYLLRICKGIEQPPAAATTAGAASDEFITVGAAPQPAPAGQLTPRSAESQATTPTAAAPATEPAADMHTVAKGETLFRISKKYNVSVAQLQQWNNKGKSTVIFNGEKLRVAPPTTGLTAKEGAVVSVLPQSFETAGSIPAGQQLRAAATPASAASAQHTVAPGETVASIAMRYGYTEARFRQFNNLGRYDVIKIGQVLKTSDCECPENQQQPAYTQALSSGLVARSPQATATAPTEMNYTAPRTAAENFSTDAFTRTVTEDSYLNTPYFLDRIITPSAPVEPAESYGYSGSRISDAGPATQQAQGAYPANLAPANLPLGYSTAPSTTPRSGDRSFYIVKEGDTLFRIARMYGLTVEHLRSVNNLGAAEVIIPYQKIYLN